MNDTGQTRADFQSYIDHAIAFSINGREDIKWLAARGLVLLTERDTLQAVNDNLLTMLAEADQRGDEYLERMYKAQAELAEVRPDSPLAVCNRTWVETVQRVMGERDLARRWAKRWAHAARMWRWQSDGDVEVGLRWRDEYRKAIAERDALAEHAANQRRQLADLQRRHQATLYELAMVRTERDEARADAAISSGFAQTWGADAHRLLATRDAELAEARAALTRIRDRCHGATNFEAVDAWDIADAALARWRANSE